MSLIRSNRLGLGGSELLCALDWVAVVLEVLCSSVGTGLVSIAFSGPTLLCLTSFFLRSGFDFFDIIVFSTKLFLYGLQVSSHAWDVVTFRFRTIAFVTGRGDRSIFKFNSLRWLQPCLVGIRGSIGSGSSGHNPGTASVATAVSVGAATAGVRGGVGLCSCASPVIALVTVAAAKSGVLEYVYGLPEATNSILDGCRFSVRHIQNFGDLPCCHWSPYMFSRPHPQCIIIVFPKQSEKGHIQRL